MKYDTMLIRLAVTLALILAALTPALRPLYAQDIAPIELDGAGSGVADPFNTTIAVMTVGEEPAPVMLALDAEGVAQAEGALDPQGMAGYVLEIEAGASVQAVILSGDAGFVLTVVGADGNPLQTDHAGASTFDQTIPVSQEYTFKVFNFGEDTQAYNFAVSVTPGATPPEAGALTGDAALGRDLVMSYFDALQANDAEQIAALLSPAFQIVRADGERFGASDYLDNRAVFETYEMSDLKVTRAGDSLIATYVVRTNSTMDKEKLGPPAPRLTVFQQVDGAWKLLAHANFAAPATVAEIPSTPAETQFTITEADNGGMVVVAAGDLIEVELPGNPTAGYFWQVTANDEAILLPLTQPESGFAQAPGSGDVVGAGGVQHFIFRALAPGEVELGIGLFPPGEELPEQVFTVAVTVK